MDLELAFYLFENLGALLGLEVYELLEVSSVGVERGVALARRRSTVGPDIPHLPRHLSLQLQLHRLHHGEDQLLLISGLQRRQRSQSAILIFDIESD